MQDPKSPFDPRNHPDCRSELKEATNSADYISKFERLDKNPAPDGTPEREDQIVRLAKRLLPAALRNAPRDQVLTQHRMFMMGWM